MVDYEKTDRLANAAFAMEQAIEDWVNAMRVDKPAAEAMVDEAAEEVAAALIEIGMDEAAARKEAFRLWDEQEAACRYWLALIGLYALRRAGADLGLRESAREEADEWEQALEDALERAGMEPGQVRDRKARIRDRAERAVSMGCGRP